MGAYHIEQAKVQRERILDELSRFVDMSRSQVTDLVFGGNVRASNRALLSLVKAKRVHRFAIELKGEYIYSLRKGPTMQTPHNLLISGLYVAMKRERPDLYGAGNCKLSDELVTDLFVRVGNMVILVEVHRATNSFGTKLERYAQLADQPWYEPGMRVVHWIVAPAQAVGWLDRGATSFREQGMEVVVTPIPDALANPWVSLLPSTPKQVRTS